MVLNGTAISRATDDAVKPGILAKKRAISSNLVDFLWARSKFRNNRSITRVLWNTYPVHCCCMKLCETQLIAEEDYKFARTHTFALLTMVIALCTIKHL